MDDIGFLIAVFCCKVSWSGVFHAMVDALDVAPVRDDAGDSALSFPGAVASLNFLDKIVSMFLVNTVFGMSG